MSFQGVSPVSFESVSAVTATPSVDLGTRRTWNNESYIYVYAATPISQSVGAIMSGVSGYTCFATGIISGAFCIGFAKHESLTTGTYGWLLTRGFVSSAVNGMVSTAIAATDGIMLGVDGKIANAAASVGGHLIGKAMTATGSAGSASFFLSVF